MATLAVTHASTHPEPTPQPTSSEHERGWKAPGVVQSLDGALLADKGNWEVSMWVKQW